MSDPLVFSPRRHRYSLASEWIPTGAVSLVDFGGYKSRANLIHEKWPEISYTSLNVGPAWYGDEQSDFVYDGSTAPFGDRSYDVTISVDTLEHISPNRRRQFLFEVKRVANRRAIIVTPFRGDSITDESILLAITRGAGIRDMPSLAEHEQYQLPTLLEIREFASALDASVHPATPRREYWSAQCAMAWNQAALGPRAEPINRQLHRYLEDWLDRHGAVESFERAYRAVLTIERS